MRTSRVPLKVSVRRLPGTRNFLLAAGLEQALDYLHTLKPLSIVYKDLKPGNVMVTPEGVAKLLDFGLARRAGDSLGGLLGDGIGHLEQMHCVANICEAASHHAAANTVLRAGQVR